MRGDIVQMRSSVWMRLVVTGDDQYALAVNSWVLDLWHGDLLVDVLFVCFLDVVVILHDDIALGARTSGPLWRARGTVRLVLVAGDELAVLHVAVTIHDITLGARTSGPCWRARGMVRFVLVAGHELVVLRVMLTGLGLITSYELVIHNMVGNRLILIAGHELDVVHMVDAHWHEVLLNGRHDVAIVHVVIASWHEVLVTYMLINHHPTVALDNVRRLIINGHVITLLGSGSSNTVAHARAHIDHVDTAVHAHAAFGARHGAARLGLLLAQGRHLVGAALKLAGRRFVDTASDTDRVLLREWGGIVGIHSDGVVLLHGSDALAFVDMELVFLPRHDILVVINMLPLLMGGRGELHGQDLHWHDSLMVLDVLSLLMVMGPGRGELEVARRLTLTAILVHKHVSSAVVLRGRQVDGAARVLVVSAAGKVHEAVAEAVDLLVGALAVRRAPTVSGVDRAGGAAGGALD